MKRLSIPGRGAEGYGRVPTVSVAEAGTRTAESSMTRAGPHY